METRANHLLIGSFVLVFLLGILGFVIWVAKIQVDREFAYYNIQFTGSVTGLAVGGDVRFNGIQVGSVRRISIDPNDASKVRVIVEVASDTPVRTDSVASLELLGITGVSYVQISGGTMSKPLLPKVRMSAELPTIQSKQSVIAEVFENAPDLVNKAVELMVRASDLLSEENRGKISSILADAGRVAEAVASRQVEISRIIESVDRTSADVADAAHAAKNVAQRFDVLADETEKTLMAVRGVVAGDGAAFVAESRRTAASLTKLSDEVQAMVAENRAPLHALTTDGVGDLRRFLDEARILIASLARVASRLEDDPSAVLFGNRDVQYKADGR